MTKEEAIKILRGAHNKALFSVRNALETLIPELKESEDERMRKRAIAILKQQRDFWSYDGPVDKFPPATPKKALVDAIDVALSYLEKKKEQKPAEQIEDNEEKSIGTTLVDALKGNAQLEWALKRAGVDVKRLISYIEEQKEQKPAEWSEEDSAKIGTLSSIIFDYAFYKDALDENNDLTGEYAELEDWLECLPERFKLPSKQEWNEEDRKDA